MLALLLLSGLAMASASSLYGKSCKVGEWSAWSDFVPSQHCRKTPLPVVSYPLPASAEWDEGRDAMTELMKAKLRSWEETDRCIADGSCPELRRRPLNGDYKCIDGMAGDIPCKNVHQLSFLTFQQMGYVEPIPGDNPRGNDVWGWRDPQNGDLYAIMGFSGGTAFVRVTDPVNPVPVGFMYSATGASSWRDIKVIGHWAFIVSEAANHGLQVFDLTRLRSRQGLGDYLVPDATLNTFGQAHNIVANTETNFVYVVGATRNTSVGHETCLGGLQVIDVSDPSNPRQVGCFGTDGYVHDAQCVIYHGPDARYQGREICFCYNENSLTIVDVHDKADMRMIAKSAYINVRYTHQGWLTEDHTVLLLDDEQDEMYNPPEGQYTKTYVWDIRDLENPTLMSIFESSERSIDHNQYIKGDYSYQANYESGLRILHINKETFQLTNVAYFDAYPSRTTAAFNGLWSVYPFRLDYDTDIIAISSINHGLFIVEPDWEGILPLVENKMTYAEQTRTRPVLESEINANCPPLVETKSQNIPIPC